MDYFSINKILLFLIDIIAIWFALWVYFADRKAKTNQIFSLMTILIFFWITFGYLTASSTTANMAQFWARLAYGSVSLFYIPFYFFFIHFFHLEKKFRKLSRIVLVIGISLFIIAIFTDFIVESAKIENWGVDLIFGRGNVLFYGVAIFLSLLVLILLIKKYFEFSPKEKLKIGYFLIGTIVWISINFVFNMILPVWQKSIQYSLIGNYSAIFLLAFTAYAIVKRELFGIRVVLTALLVSSMSILLLFDILVLTEAILAQLFKALLLIIFLYFGYSLIKSVLREIKYREQLQKAYKDLKRLDQAKSEFLSIASHQLRTPLTAIKGYISMIIEGTFGKLPKKAEKPLENAYKSNERLIKLINDLLNISRIEAGKIKMEFEKSKIEDIVKSVIEELELEAKRKNLYLKWTEPKTSLPKVFIDKSKVRQVISNIIDNAIRYTQKGGVTIDSEVEDSKLRIIIRDTGEGIKKEDLSKVFESFSRGGAGTQLYTEGAGLGLYVARKFIEMHKGKIWVESEGKGKGSQFYIELPTIK